MRTFGLIPAAGKSRRMGQPKLLLPLGEKTVLEAVVSAVRAAGIEELLVVAAPHADTLVERAGSAGAHVLRLPLDTPDMRATCLHGLEWIERHFHPESVDSWLLLPADHPTLNPDVIRALRTAARENPGATIIVPAHQGRRGHPTWLSWTHARSMLVRPPEEGLNAYIRRHASETHEMDWPHPDVLWDMDTPEDYQRLLTESTRSFD